MLKKCCEYLVLHTQHWEIDPIVDYYTLNLAACLAASHASLIIMSDMTIPEVVRAQHCEIFIYLNQLLRTQKSGRLYKKTKYQLSRSVRGYRHNRELMLPFIPDEIFFYLSSLMDASHKIITYAPISSEFVTKIPAKLIDIINNRIYRNSETEHINFNANVLKCEGCCRLFFGGRGENDVRLFQEHLQEFPTHRLPNSNQKISSRHWKLEYENRKKDLQTKHSNHYSEEQKQAFDAVMQGSTTLVLMGVAGSGKSTLAQDLRYLLECIFWGKNEIAVCGVTNAIAQRMSPTGSSFHKFLGLKPLASTAMSKGDDWNLSVEYCMCCMRKKEKLLKMVCVVIIEEGLELQSNVLEAYFRFKKEIKWDVITIINGDPCQGNYRVDDDRQSEVPFFAKSMLIAEICPNIEICTFTQDLRTKNILLRDAKMAVRYAKVTPAIFNYLKELKYLGQETQVDIILCTHICHMTVHNQKLLAENPNGSKTYIATSLSISERQHTFLNYKQHGVQHELQLKQDAPIMISYDVEVFTNRGAKTILRNGTTGKVVELHSNSIKVVVPLLGGIIAEVKPIPIPDTSWKQIPVILAYAATISKCIGFEFDHVAVDFGLQGRTDEEIAMQSNAHWRRKMAYTAITRAKQRVYFVGLLHLNIFNNMDKIALDFFNSKVNLNKTNLKESISVVRDVQELKEFWIQSSKHKRNAASNFDVADEPSAKKTKFDVFDNTQRVIAYIDGHRIEIFAKKYPHVIQHIHGQGHLVAGTSNQYQNVILKVPSRRIEQKYIDAEYGLLCSLRDVEGILHVLAKVDRHPTTFVMEGMKSMVPWEQFILRATTDAKERFKMQLHLVLVEIHVRQKVHGNISKKSVLTNMRGDVKLTWFQSNVLFCNETMQQDIKCMQDLCSELRNGAIVSGHDSNQKPLKDYDGSIHEKENDDDKNSCSSRGGDNSNDDNENDEDKGFKHGGGADDSDDGIDDTSDTVDDDGDDAKNDDNNEEEVDDTENDGEDEDDEEVEEDEETKRYGKTQDGTCDCENDDDNDDSEENDSDDSNDIGFDDCAIETNIELLNLSIQKHYNRCNGAILDDNWCFFDSMVLLCSQGSDGAFDLNASLHLWGLVHPLPEVKHNILNNKTIKEINYGSTFEFFVHPCIWNAATAFNNERLTSLDHSFAVHIGVKLKKCPVALDAMFRQGQGQGYCCANIQQNTNNCVKSNSGAWLPEILLKCWPREFLNMILCILQVTQDNHIQVQIFQCLPETRNRDTMEVVLKRFGDSYTLLDIDISLVLELVSIADVQYFYLKCCTSMNSIVVSQIQLPSVKSANIASHQQFKQMWDEAIKTVDLTQDLNGRWTTTPPGLNGQKHLQDGSLQSSGWFTLKNELFTILSPKRVNIVDFGSEGGYCIAQFAIDPLVQSIAGKEIQYPWVAYSAMILCSMFMQSKHQNTHFAGIQLLLGSFLNLCDTTWMTAVACADIIHCDNWNWWKSDLIKKDAIIPQKRGNSNARKSTDSNVAYLLRRIIKDCACIVVYNPVHFHIGFNFLRTFDACANWNTVTKTSINILQLDKCYSSQLRSEMQVSGDHSEAQMVSADVLTREFFQCDCKMPLIFFGRIAARDTNICASCQVCRDQFFF